MWQYFVGVENAVGVKQSLDLRHQVNLKGRGNKQHGHSQYEEKGWLVAQWEEFSQWLTSGGGPEIQLAVDVHFKKPVDTRQRGK